MGDAIAVESEGPDALAATSGVKVEDARAPTFRVAWAALEESRWRRWLWVLGAVVVAGLFLVAMERFNVRVDQGVDENGYLVGARMIADHGSASFRPTDPYTGAFDPYRFIGRMWVGADYNTPYERYYPKYPIGLSLIMAGVLKLRSAHAAQWVFLVNPVAMALAVLGTFFVVREWAGSYLGVLGALVFACSPVTLMLTNDANSHATAVCCVVWGMALVGVYGRRPGWGVGIGAGLLLGYAFTIRYSEGAMALPLGIVLLLTHRWKSLWSWARCVAVTAAWAVPVVGLLAYNKVALGTWTGYGPSNESTGFTLKSFGENWETSLHVLSGVGLVFVFPLSIAGLAAAVVRRWRLGLVLAAWVVPNLLLYTAYYWAPGWAGIWYARFFLTSFPGLIAAAAYMVSLMGHALGGGAAAGAVVGRPNWRARLAATLAGGILAGASAGYGLFCTVGKLDMDNRMRHNTLYLGSQLSERMPAGSVLIGRDEWFMQYLQYLRPDVRLYRSEIFDGNLLTFFEKDTKNPQVFDPKRREVMEARFKPLYWKLESQEQELVARAVEHGHRVFFLGPYGFGGWIRRAAPPGQFEIRTRAGSLPYGNVDMFKLIVFAPDKHTRQVPGGGVGEPWALHEAIARPRAASAPASLPVSP